MPSRNLTTFKNTTMAPQDVAPRYPERSSSLSAIDFPHGPPNSPVNAMTLVPDEEISAIALAEEDEITNALHRSLSKYEIREPMVEEFTFEPIDASVNVGDEDIQLLPAALKIKTIIATNEKEDEDNVDDHRVVLSGNSGVGLEEATGVDNKIEHVTTTMQEIDLSDKDEVEKPQGIDADSRSPSTVETPQSAIVRPATPMVPLVFGRKNTATTLIESQKDLEKTYSSPIRADAIQQTIAVSVPENYKENKLSPAQLISNKKTFVVAISGCSSAGKSTLAKILSEVFQTPTVNGDGLGGGKVKPTITIAQDDFFHPKGLQPFVTFTSTPADAPFMEKSIHHDELGM